MVQRLEAELVPDMLRRDCRQCRREQAHYRMGDPEVAELGRVCAEYQCMGCMQLREIELAQEGVVVEDLYEININPKRTTFKSSF